VPDAAGMAWPFGQRCTYTTIQTAYNAPALSSTTVTLPTSLRTPASRPATRTALTDFQYYGKTLGLERLRFGSPSANQYAPVGLLFPVLQLSAQTTSTTSMDGTIRVYVLLTGCSFNATTFTNQRYTPGAEHQ